MTKVVLLFVHPSPTVESLFQEEKGSWPIRRKR